MFEIVVDGQYITARYQSLTNSLDLELALINLLFNDLPIEVKQVVYDFHTRHVGRAVTRDFKDHLIAMVREFDHRMSNYFPHPMMMNDDIEDID